MNSIKALAESPGLNSLPSIYAFSNSNNEVHASDPQDSIPVIDLSLLTSIDLDTRSQAIQELHNAGKDWGFFQMIIEKGNEFFNMTDEEKKDFEEKDVSDPVRYGTSFKEKDNPLFWRDYLRLVVHPEFHSLNKPLGLSEIIFDYSKRTREVARRLLGGISTGLGLDQSNTEKALEWESGFGAFGISYPPCPHPELAMGLPPHSDHVLLNLLMHNGVGGLHIKHDYKWVHVKDTYPNSYLVIIGDQIEILSNGKYKSVEHCVVANNTANMRITVMVASGPSLDAVVRPADELVDEEKCPAAYTPIKYKEYMELKRIKQYSYVKTCLDLVRL